MTAAERAAKAEQMRRAWAEGRFANRPKPKHRRAWSAAETLLLKRLAGRETPARIAAIVSAESGMERTETAVLIRMKRLGLSPTVGHHTARSLGWLFGVDPKAVTHSWVRRGWLGGERVHDLAGGSWIFRDAHVEAFVRTHPNAYDWRRMRPGRWRSLAETVWKADPLLTLDQAARAIGVNRETLRNHCAKGWLPSLRRYEKGGARGGRLLIRRSALGGFNYRRPEMVGRSGRKRRAA